MYYWDKDTITESNDIITAVVSTIQNDVRNNDNKAIEALVESLILLDIKTHGRIGAILNNYAKH